MGVLTSFLYSSSWIAPLMSLSLLTDKSYLGHSVRLLVAGTVIEMIRRFGYWLMQRIQLGHSMTARFSEGDPTYDWILHFVTEKKLWMRSRQFNVSTSSAKLEWAVENGPENMTRGNVHYVPTYELPLLFRWKGHWLELRKFCSDFDLVQRAGINAGYMCSISLTVYTRDLSVLPDFVEDARKSYNRVNKPNVMVHSADSMMLTSFPPNPSNIWSNIQRKPRRELESIILQDGVMDSLIQDAHEFVDMEGWYTQAGIPHRLGFLLYGPPGTGKTSTIYAFAGEMGFEIYSLSLASQSLDDSLLRLAASAVPKYSIFLIEDIDCAFPSRETQEQMVALDNFPRYQPPRRSPVTLSGLLNVIDGVGSEDGRIFIATTNHIDRLDPALLRPGRIDRLIKYSLATHEQAKKLYLRFYPRSRMAEFDVHGEDEDEFPMAMAIQFAECIPSDEFSTAELQGYLLGHKKTPKLALCGMQEWIEIQRQARRGKPQREKQPQEKLGEEKQIMFCALQ